MKKPVLLSAILAAAVFLCIVIAMLRVKKGEPDRRPDAGKDAAEKPAVAAPIENGIAPEAPALAPAKETSRPRVTTDATSPSGLEGQVVSDGSPRPLSGAIVRAALDRGADPHDEPAWLRDAITDGRGRFKLEDLPFTPLRLRASLPGYLDGEAAGVFPGDEAKIVLVKQEGVSCIVEVDREEGSSPLPRQKVFVSIAEGGWSFEADTDDAGKVLLTGIDRVELERARKDRRVEAIVPGYAQGVITAVPPGDGYKITVEPGATVTGTVLDARTGKPVPHAMVHSESGHEVEVDARGVFSISGVDDDLTAYAPGYSIQTKDLDDHDADEKLRMDFLLERGLTLRGKVVDSKARPIAGVKVALATGGLDLDSTSEKLEGRILEGLSSLSDANGQYRLEGLPRQALDLPGEVELEIVPRGALRGFSYGVELDGSANDVEQDIVIDLQEALVGLVKDSGGKPVARAGVFIESDEEDFLASTGTNAEGRFRLPGIRHGNYRVRVERDGRTVHVSDLVVPSDALTLTLEALASVKGQVLADGTTEPLAGLRVSLHSASGAGAPVAGEVTTDESGRFAIANVPRGAFMLLLSLDARSEPYSRLAREVRHPIEVTEAGWVGEVPYPVLPSGEVKLAFAVAGANGSISPAEGPVWVAVTSYFPSGEVPETPARGESQLVQDARQGFQVRWHEGEYRVRCSITIEGKQILKDETFSLAAGGKVERTVTFAAGR